MSSDEIAFSIVIPAYNEERRLPMAIRDIQTFFSAFGIPFECLVMVEHSKDQTLALAKQARGDDARFAVYDNGPQRGKGFAVKSGMLRARGPIIFFMDADLSTPLSETLAFLAHFSANPDVDILIGDRASRKSRILKKQTWLRSNLGRVFNCLVRFFVFKEFSDTQCGFKAFRQKPSKEIFTRTTLDGFAFDVEALLLSKRLGFKVQSLPIRWVNSPESKVRIPIDALKMLADLLRVQLIVRKTLRAKPFVP
jgi:dolichyl-phosphate beta-glucosyltransferase